MVLNNSNFDLSDKITAITIFLLLFIAIVQLLILVDLNEPSIFDIKIINVFKDIIYNFNI